MISFAIIFLMCLAFGYLLIPTLLRKKIEPGDPLLLISIPVFIGLVLRTIHIYINNDITHINLYFLNGSSFESLLDTALYLNLCFLFLTIGYLSINKKISLQKSPFFKGNRISPPKIRLLAILVIPLSVIFFFLYLEEIGYLFTGMTSISGKRTVSVGGSGYSVTTLGYLRYLISLSEYILYIFAVYLFYKKNRSILDYVIITLLFLVSMMGPFFNSQRGAVLIIIINVLIIIYYLQDQGGIFRYLKYVVIILVLLNIMSSFRGSRSNEIEDIYTNTLFATLVESRNFIDLSVNDRILSSVPGLYNYQYGSTLFTWLYAPIPRKVWENKPIINVGQEIGNKIYGHSTYQTGGGGVPPGITGELYLNFGYFALIIMFIFGVFLKILFNTFKGLNEKPETKALSSIVFIPIIFNFSFVLIGSSLSKIIIDTLVFLFIIFIFKKFITK